MLARVRTEGAYVNLLLPVALRRADLTGRDAALTTELVSGTVRMQLTYDTIIDSLVDKSPQAKVRDVLRLGAHQLLAMRVPTHAAIDTTVELAGRGPRGFVNAVLRRIADRSLDEWLDQLDAEGADLAFRYSHPQWVVDELAASLVEVRAQRASKPGELEALLAADNVPPKVTLVARPGLVTVEELVRQSAGRATGRSPYAVVLDSGDPGAIAAVADGRAGVQDEGSQLVAISLAAAKVEGRDERWLDLCAGPGGKAALLGAIGAERGARVVANEVQQHRAGLVEQAVRALDNVEVVTGDGTKPSWEKGSFDRVLVDAPCTGLGALRRRPEARWRRKPEDLADLVRLQEALLHAAIDSTRPGGVVMYSTCSPALAETTGVVSSVLAERFDARVESTFQLWPHTDGTDAMFGATLRVGT